MRNSILIIIALHASSALAQEWAWAYPFKTIGGCSIRSVNTDLKGNPVFMGNVYDSIYFHAANGIFPSAKEIQCFVTKYNTTGDLLWQSGGTAGAGLEGRSMSIDSQSNCFITGFFVGTATFGSGTDTLTRSSFTNSYEYFFVKLDPLGKAKTFINDGKYCFNGGESVTSLTSDELIVSWWDEQVCNSPGGVNNLQKVDNYGNVIWSKTVPTQSFATTFSPDEITATRDNGFLITNSWIGPGALCFGDTSNYLCLSPPSGLYHSDAYLAKYSSNGNLRWARALRGNNGQYVQNITTDNSNNILFLASGYDTTVYDGQSLNPMGWRTQYLIKADTAGVFVNYLALPLDTFQTAWRGYWVKQVKTDKFDNIYLAGTLNSTVEIGGQIIDLKLKQFQYAYFIVKLDKNLNYVWSQHFSSDVYNPTFNCELAVSEDYVFIGANHNTSVYLNNSPYKFNLPNTNQSWSFIAAIYNGPRNVNSVEEKRSALPLTVYPNPSNGHLRIIANSSDDVQITIMNVVGEHIFDRTYPGEGENQIDITDQPSGVYFLRLETEGHNTVKKIMIR